VAPIYPTSIHWSIRFGGSAEVLPEATIEAKTSSGVLKCTLINLLCVTRESH